MVEPMTEVSSTAEISTADTILDAVTGVFAEKGYNGARVDELARAAGVNKATLYYQIGDKEALYHAVLEREFSYIADTIEQAVMASNDCEVQIRNFISAFAARISESGDIAQLMLREIVSGGSHLPDKALAQMGRVLNLLTNALRKGIEQQRFRPVNVFMLHMMIVGSLNLYAVNEPIRRRVLASNAALSDNSHNLDISISRAGDEVADLILAAIRTAEQRP
jgi:TetR/AcrR family transcriptional regulator